MGPQRAGGAQQDTPRVSTRGSEKSAPSRRVIESGTNFVAGLSSNSLTGYDNAANAEKAREQQDRRSRSRQGEASAPKNDKESMSSSFVATVFPI